MAAVRSGLADAKLAPFIANMHTALWALAVTSVIGTLVSLLRPRRPVGEWAAGKRGRPTTRRSACFRPGAASPAARPR